MNIVREHINEKFSEDSDPIKDMGIGIKFAKIKLGDILKIKHEYPLYVHNTTGNILFKQEKRSYAQYTKYTIYSMGTNYHIYSVVINIDIDAERRTPIYKLTIIPFGAGEDHAKVIRKEFFLYQNAVKKRNYSLWHGKTDILTWDKYFEIINEDS